MQLPSFFSTPSMLRRRWLARGLLIALAALAAAYLSRNLLFGPAVDVYELRPGSIIQTVVATGRIMTPQRTSVGSVITERVARIPVGEGQTVRSGDILFVLDDRDERAAVAQAEAAIAQAQAKLRQMREVGLPAAEQALIQARATLALTQHQFQRNEDLLARGFISQSALDDSKRNLDVAQSQLDAATLEVESNRPTGSEYSMALTALAQAQAALAGADARLEQTVVRAPADGILIGRNVEPGDIAQPGKELMVLAPAGETQVIVQIDEKNLAQLKVGQQALVSADAYPRERFPAELFYINPGIDPLRGSVEVKLRVPAPPQYLRQDMTVSVDIDIAHRADALVAPVDAVFDLAGGHPWVLTIVDHRARRKPVTIGLRGDSNIEITDGAVVGDRVVSAAAGISDGQRVRIGGVALPLSR